MKNNRTTRTTIAVTQEVRQALDDLIIIPDSNERYLSKSEKIKILISRAERGTREVELHNENNRIQAENKLLQAENKLLQAENEKLMIQLSSLQASKSEIDLLNEHITLLRQELQRQHEKVQKFTDESAITNKLLDIPTEPNQFTNFKNSQLFKTLQHGSAEEKARRGLLAILEWNSIQKTDETMVYPSNSAIRRVTGCNGTVIKRVIDNNINSIPSSYVAKTRKVKTAVTKKIRELMLEDKLPSVIPGEASDNTATKLNRDDATTATKLNRDDATTATKLNQDDATTATKLNRDDATTATKLNRDDAIKSIALKAITSLEAIVFDYSFDSTEDDNNALVDLGGRVQEVIKESFDNLIGLVDTIPNKSVHSIRKYRTVYLSEFESLGNNQPPIHIAGLDFWKFVAQKMRAYFFKNAPAPTLLQSRKNLDERASQVKRVNAMPLIKWAIETLDKEAVDGEPIDWTEAALAVTILTGRRRSEILGTAEFNHIDNDWVIFHGKTKGHPMPGQENEKPKPEKLLTLGASSRRVIRGLQIVRNAIPFQGPDYDGSYSSIKALAKTINHSAEADKYADTCRQVMTRLLASDDELTIAIDGVQKSLATPHRIREIYASIAWRRWQVIDPKVTSVKPGVLIPRTLHDGKGVRDNYDASFEILDADIIAQIPDAL